MSKSPSIPTDSPEKRDPNLIINEDPFLSEARPSESLFLPDSFEEVPSLNIKWIQESKEDFFQVNQATNQIVEGTKNQSSEAAIVTPSPKPRIVSKDRHTKVKTRSGLKDRRVRLSAPAAVAFYDVQERLGVDHPSATVEWLLHQASHAIKKLPHLPKEDEGKTTSRSVEEVPSPEIRLMSRNLEADFSLEALGWKSDSQQQ